MAHEEILSVLPPAPRGWGGVDSNFGIGRVFTVANTSAILDGWLAQLHAGARQSRYHPLDPDVRANTLAVGMLAQESAAELLFLFRIHAEFKVSLSPALFVMPSRFDATLRISRDLETVHHLHILVPTERVFNVLFECGDPFAAMGNHIEPSPSSPDARRLSEFKIPFMRREPREQIDSAEAFGEEAPEGTDAETGVHGDGAELDIDLDAADAATPVAEYYDVPSAHDHVCHSDAQSETPLLGNGGGAGGGRTRGEEPGEAEGAGLKDADSELNPELRHSNSNARTHTRSENRESNANAGDWESAEEWGETARAEGAGGAVGGDRLEGASAKMGLQFYPGEETEFLAEAGENDDGAKSRAFFQSLQTSVQEVHYPCISLTLHPLGHPDAPTGEGLGGGQTASRDGAHSQTLMREVTDTYVHLDTHINLDLHAHAEAQEALAVAMYPFLDVGYTTDYEKAFRVAKQSRKLVFGVVLWGALDDASC